MFDSIWTTISHQFASNQFLTGATLTGVLVGAVAWLRALINRAIVAVRVFYTVSLTVHSEDVLYIYISAWLHQHGFDRFSKSYRLRYLEGRPMYGPAVGTFTFVHSGRLVKVMIQAEANQNGGSSYRSQNREFLTVSYLSLSRSRTFMESIVCDAIEEARRADDNGVAIYAFAGQFWSEVARVKRRRSPSIILRDGELERIEADVEQWLNRADWYIERGVPYRRGYLLTGPPGTGKTSLVRHLAQRFGMSVYISDGSIRSIQQVPENSILLLEDVDSITRMREAAAEYTPRDLENQSRPPALATQGGGVPSQPMDVNAMFAPTLSALLNALDGLASVERVLVVMTTNHPERLDHAMVRPGRVDYRLHLSYCDVDQAMRMFVKFYRPDETLVQRFVQVVGDCIFTPAQLQNIFLESVTVEQALMTVASRSLPTRVTRLSK